MIKFQGRVVESTSIKNFSRCSRVCGSKLVGLRRLQHNCFQSSTTNDGHIYMLTNIVWPSCVSPGLGREYRIEKTQNRYSYWSSGPPCLDLDELIFSLRALNCPKDFDGNIWSKIVFRLFLNIHWLVLRKNILASKLNISSLFWF